MEKTRNIENRILKTRERRIRRARPSFFCVGFLKITIRSFFPYLRPSRPDRPESLPHSKPGVPFPHAGFQRRATRRPLRCLPARCEESERQAKQCPESARPNQ